MAVYSVSEFVQGVNNLLQGVPATVQGEVSNFKIAQNKFVWFDLKDDSSVVNCFMMKFQLQHQLEDGMEIRVIGNPGLFKRSGRFHLRAQQIQLVGEGTLKRQYELLKKKLTTEGIFDQSRKRALPEYPSRIAIVTSRGAAAYTDVLRILNNRWSGLEISLFHVQVQGASATSSVVSALELINTTYSDAFDVVILTRGGGSMEDLQSFNEEAVVRAVFGLKIPSVVAIGHERDETLAELAADQRASTPSNAAELVVPDRVDVLRQLQQQVNTQERSLRFLAQQQQHLVSQQVSGLERYSQVYTRSVESMMQRFQLSAQRWQHGVTVLHQNIQQASKLLHSYNPSNVLERGYSITRDPKGKVLYRPAKLRLVQLSPLQCMMEK